MSTGAAVAARSGARARARDSRRTALPHGGDTVVSVDCRYKSKSLPISLSTRARARRALGKGLKSGKTGFSVPCHRAACRFGPVVPVFT